MCRRHHEVDSIGRKIVYNVIIMGGRGAEDNVLTTLMQDDVAGGQGGQGKGTCERRGTLFAPVPVQ